MRRGGLVIFAAAVTLAACSSSEGSGPTGGGDGTTNRPKDPPPPVDKDAPPKPAVEEPPVVPAEPAVVFIGRFAVDGDVRTFGWPNTRIVARFEGTSVSAKLSEQNLYEGPSELDVSLDGQTKRLVLKEGEHTYQLAKDLVAGAHTVEIVRRVEGQVGITKFAGFDFGGGKLLPPPPRRKRRIEFLGDSNTTGYGIEGNGPNCPFSAATQNFAKTYAAKVADAFDADAIVTAYSGKGVIQNNDRTDPIVFEDLFGRAAPESATPAWDFTKAPAPDAVVINLGSNDYAQPDENVVDPPVFGSFKAKFGKLVTITRAAYPRTPIFLLVSPTQNDDYPSGFGARTSQRKAYAEIAAERKAAGDTNVHFIDLPATDDPRDACDYHPGVKLHENMATALIAEMKKKTGW